MSIILFKPDIFSNSQPLWRKASLDLLPDLKLLISSHLPDEFKSNINTIEYSGGLEINSSNFRVTSNGKTVLVKRWSKMIKESNLEKIVGIMNWLDILKMKVPKPIVLKSGNSYIKIGEYYWSCFPFIFGDYFSGKGDEINDAALITGRLTQVLTELPLELNPDMGPIHLTEDDTEILNEIDTLKNHWDDLFGIDHANLLRTTWEDLMNNWNKIIKEKKYAGQINPVHFDLHPHNLIFRDTKLEAILDFESCKMMPVGYAISFAALKQCRQSVVEKNNINLAKEIGKSYLKIISSEYKLSENFIHDFYDLSLTEIIRRICLIFRLNLNGNRDWNKVLPIQIAHMYEANALFA